MQNMENAADLINQSRDLPLGWFAGLDSGQLWTEYQKRKPGIGFEIFDGPPSKVNIRYLSADQVFPWEKEVRIDWEGRDIGFLVPPGIIDMEKGTVPVLVWDIGRETILFRMPGEDVNATGTQFWASREWLDRMKVDETRGK